MTLKPPQTAQSPAVPFPALLREIGAVELLGQIAKSGLQFGDAHMIGLEIDIEQRAQLPGIFLQEPPLRLQPVIKRGARKRRQNRNLHLVEATVTHEIPYVIEACGIGAVET